ncbi:MAG: DUF1295 domain-containing protein [Dehalococcoidaceae bacterium]|nr:DUF1295 domain-containing protein [Dehalococcoidaceae bacterium]
MENVSWLQYERTRGFALCAAAYLLALIAAVFAGAITGDSSPVTIAFAGIIASTLVIYAFARFTGNASMFDPYWSVAPLVVAVYFWLVSSGEAAVPLRQFMVILLVVVWSIRLTLNWAGSWQGLGHEDWRYRDLRQKSGRWFWLVELAGIELMPALVIFTGCLSLYPALVAGSAGFGLLDVVAAGITGGAIAMEAVADRQLKAFTAGGTGGVMEKGLWAYSRHPNYFGEVMFWWGLFVFALAAEPSYWWTFIGPLAVTVLFVTISIPLMEQRNLKRRPGYTEYQRRTPVFFPWIRRY